MAIAKAGGGVTELRGSISGNTFSRNRGGMIVRARTVPTNTRSSAQSKSRSLFAYLTSAWNKNLTPTQRTAWDSYAHAVLDKNKLGEGVHLTGQLQFIRTNQVRMTAGMSLVTEGPSVLSLPETDPTLAIAGETPPIFAVTFDESQSWRTEDGGAISLVVSQPQPATKNYFTGPWRFAGAILGSSESPPTSPTVLSLPFPVAAGQKLFARACILRADGRTTNPFDLAPKIYTAMTRFITANSILSDYTYLRNLSGDIIQTYPKPDYLRGIHQDPIDNTLWGVIPTTDYIINFKMVGTNIVNISNANVAGRKRGFDGCCIDTRDGSLWLPGDTAGYDDINHYTRHVDGSNQHTLIESFDTHSFIFAGKDICFDSSDNTLWIPDPHNQKIWHISSATGLEISGTLTVTTLGLLPNAEIYCIEYYAPTNTLYLGDYINNVIYHISKTGVLIDTIQNPPAKIYFSCITLAPTSIQG